MSNILEINLVKITELQDGSEFYTVMASDSYCSGTFGYFETEAEMYQAYPTKADLVRGVLTMDCFVDIDCKIDDEGNIIEHDDDLRMISGIDVYGYKNS